MLGCTLAVSGLLVITGHSFGVAGAKGASFYVHGPGFMPGLGVAGAFSLNSLRKARSSAIRPRVGKRADGHFIIKYACEDSSPRFESARKTPSHAVQI